MYVYVCASTRDEIWVAQARRFMNSILFEGNNALVSFLFPLFYSPCPWFYANPHLLLPFLFRSAVINLLHLTTLMEVALIHSRKNKMFYLWISGRDAVVDAL